MSEHEEKNEDKEVHGEASDYSKTRGAKAGSKAKRSGGITGYVHGVLQGALDLLSKTLRSFVAFSMAMFFFGALFGHFVPQFTDKLGLSASLVLAVPLFLSLLSYYFTEIAALIFILMLGLFLLFFL